MMTDKIRIKKIQSDFPISQLDHKAWENAEEVLIEKYWSGKKAPIGRCAKAKLLWSPNSLYVRFEANQNEPLIISEVPNLKSKTIGLWDRDVCEIFVAPDRNQPEKYYEFEIAPNGEWIDLAVQQLPEKRETDWDYHSGMQSATQIENDKITMAIKVEWQAFGNIPKEGAVWLGNLFRCVGEGEERGYLAWQPTKTPQPNFHVSDAFGEFEFVR
jgi:hypothetical protein